MKENNEQGKNLKESKTVSPVYGEKQNTVQKIQDYIEANRNMVLYIAGGIIVVVALFFFMKNKMEKSAEEERNAASFALAKVTNLYLANDYERALKGDPTILVNNKPMLGLVDICTKYKGTKQAAVAALYAGNCYIGLDKYADAEKYFKLALDAESQIVLEGANAGLGACSETNGKYDEAVKYYEKAVSLTKIPGIKNRYQYFQGLCFEKLGQKDKAEKIYRDIIAENISEFVNPAKAGLIRIGMIIE